MTGEDMRRDALSAATFDSGLIYAVLYVGDQLARIADRLEAVTEVRSTSLGGLEGYVRTRARTVLS